MGNTTSMFPYTGYPVLVRGGYYDVAAYGAGIFLDLVQLW